MALATRDIMTAPVTTVGPDMSLLELENTLRTGKIGGAPVVADGKLVGMVARSDIIRQLAVEDTYAEFAYDLFEQVYGLQEHRAEDVGQQVGERLTALRVKDAMVAAVDTIGPDTDVKTLAATMLSHHHRRMVVTDASNSILGIVTASDLVRLVADGVLGET